MVKKTGKVLSWLIPVAVAIALGLMLSVILHQLDVGAEERDQQHAEIVALQAGLDEANKRLTDEGEPPVPVPSVSPGATQPQPQIILGERGPQGERGPAGVRGPQGRTGPPGEAGPRGPIGPRGAAGNVGATGETGATGATGPMGPTGRGIQSMQCATGGWVITYTDSLTSSDVGPCRGPQGETGPQGVHGLQGPQGPAGPQGTAKPGTYTCPDGEYVGGFTIAADGAVSLTCRAPTPPPVIGPPNQ